MLDPQQELFIRLKRELEAIGYAVYDGFLPPDGTPYPFIYLGECQQVDDENKTAVFGNVFLTIHLFHNTPRQRGTVSKILLDIKTACRKIERTESFSWAVRNINQRIFPDNTTKTPLIHGVVEAEFKFS